MDEGQNYEENILLSAMNEDSVQKERLIKQSSQIAKNLSKEDSNEEININLVMNQGFVFIWNNDLIPFAQIAFVDDCYPNYNALVGVENFLQQKNISQVPWTSVQDFVLKAYPTEEEKNLASQYIKQNMRDSKLLQTLHAILNEKVDKEWHEMVAENLISMNLRGIEMIEEMLLEDLISLALRLFLQQGFDQSFDGLSVFLKIQPLQLILAFVDCFPQYGDMVYSLILKQGIISRNILKSKSQQNTSLFQQNRQNKTPLPLSHYDAENMINSKNYIDNEEQYQNERSNNPDEHFANYIQSFITFAQIQREGGDKQDHTLYPDSHGRIILLKEIINELNSTPPFIMRDFLKKQFQTQIRNIRECIKNQVNESKEDGETVDKIESQVIGGDDSNYDFDKSYSQIVYLDSEEQQVQQKYLSIHQLNTKINFDAHRLEAWNLLYAKIQSQVALTKHEEDQWRYFAFETALVSLGERVLILENDVQSAIKCYQILYCLGHKKSSTILYSLLCLTEQYSQAAALVMHTNLNVQKSYALLKIQQTRKGIDLISRNCKTSNQIGSKLQFCYFLSTVLEKQSKYLAALTAFFILNKNLQTEQDIGLIFKLFILGKLVQKGLYFEQSDINANKIFNYIQNNLKPVYLYEYITMLFVQKAKQTIINKKNMQNGNNKSRIINPRGSLSRIQSISKIENGSQTMKNSQLGSSSMQKLNTYSSTIKSKTLYTEKSDKATQSQQNWDQFIETTLNTSILKIRIFLDKEHQKFQNIIHNINTDHETRRDYHLAYTLGQIILFRNQNDYSRSYFDENKGRILRENQRNAKILNDFLAPTMMWPLNLVKPQDEKYYQQNYEQLQQQNNSEDQSPSDFIIDDTPQNNSNKNKNKNQSIIPLIRQSLTQDGNQQFEGRLVKDLPARLNENETIMHKEEKDVERKIGHFTLNNQIFSKWVVKPKYLKNGECSLDNLSYCVSPFFLNIYAQSFHDSSIFTEPYLCTFEQLTQNKLQYYGIDETKGKLIKEISGLLQIVSLCVSLHNAQLYGYLSFFGKNIIYIDHEGFFKTPNILTLIDGNFPIDWDTIPHEMLLDEGSQEEISKCDVWAVGSLLLKLFYNQNIVNETNPQNQIDQYLADVSKFKTQEHLDNIFASCNIETNNQQKKQSNTEGKQNQTAEEKYFDVSKMNYDLRWIIESLIRKCLRYEPCSRPSSVELLLEIHEYIKQYNPEGIFTVYNIDSVTQKSKSLKRSQFLPTKDNEKQTDQQKENNIEKSDLNKIQNSGNNQNQQNLNEEEGRKQKQTSIDIEKKKDEQENENNNNNKENNENLNKNENILIQNQTDQDNQNNNKQQQNDIINQSKKSESDTVFFDNKENQKNTNHRKQNNSEGDQTVFKNQENRPISAIQKKESQQKIQILDSIKENDFEGSHEFSSMTKFNFIPGGSVLLRQGDKSFYFTPFNTEFHINNKAKKKDDSNLKELLIGEGIMRMQEDRVFQGYFGDFGLPHSGYLQNQFTKKGSLLGFDDKTRMPKSDAEKTFIDDTKDKQELMREQQQLNKFIASTNHLFNSTKKFLDFFGNWISCDFIGKNCVPSISSKTSPILYITENKTLFISTQQQKAFLFDYSIMTYSIFNEIQGIQAPQDKITSLLETIKSLSNNSQVVQHLLEGCKYTGGLQNWDPVEGKLSFYDTEIQVNGSAQRSLVYQTVLKFPTGDCYKGGLLNGKYWDYGRLYSNNRLVQEGKFIDNSMVQGTLYYTDDKLKYVGEVFFDESNDTYKKHGKGVLYLRNGDVYDGEFSLDLYHGFGKILYDGGNKGYFEGEFYEGMKHGPGFYCDKQKGIEFNGEYVYNKRCNFGIERVLNKYEYKGNFKEGKKSGQGIMFYQNGKIKSYEGYFEDDKKHGEGIEKDDNGNVYKTKYWKDGLISSTILKKIPQNNQQNKLKNDEEPNFYKFT